jgi:hypothetical protein
MTKLTPISGDETAVLVTIRRITETSVLLLAALHMTKNNDHQLVALWAFRFAKCNYQKVWDGM